MSGTDRIREAMEHVLAVYGSTPPRTPTGRGHPLWSTFEDLQRAFSSLPFVRQNRHLRVDWSIGVGGQSRVPWIAFLDDRLTRTTRTGVYCVYLFREDMSGVCLTINQGSTGEEPQFYTVRRTSRARLREQAERLRPRFRDLEKHGFSMDTNIDLRTESPLGKAYEVGTIAHKFYATRDVPNDEVLLDDLERALSAYERYAASPEQAEHRISEDGAVVHNNAHVVTPTLTMEWLEEKTLWDRDRLIELCGAIKDESPQLILSGPPGTGKTWVAKHVAEYLTQDATQVFRVVQFHPSYSYEEFVEGLRPVADERGAIIFEEVPGVVLRMVEDIQGKPEPHILLIDEINRANLPKVLGELMYLFEYRNEQLDLMYTSGFSLPDSLKFVGTMNTADRSIRSIDTALRRRFDILECPPDSTVLERFYKTRTNEIPDLVNGFEALNAELQNLLDRHHTIGQTFFMANPLTVTYLRKAWDRKIRPLIEEYFFDQPDVAISFTVDKFWPKAR